jgi:hypothetical protein
VPGGPEKQNEPENKKTGNGEYEGKNTSDDTTFGHHIVFPVIN